MPIPRLNPLHHGRLKRRTRYIAQVTPMDKWAKIWPATMDNIIIHIIHAATLQIINGGTVEVGLGMRPIGAWLVLIESLP